MSVYEFTPQDVDEAYEYLKLAQEELDFSAEDDEDTRVFAIILYCIKKTKENIMGNLQ